MKQGPSVTLKRIAEQLGISVTTVSRSLSGEARRYRIGRETEQAVRELAESLGFTPNQLARGLRLKKTATIGLVIPDVSNPFFAGIARQIAIGARDDRYSVIVCDSQENDDLEIESLELLRARGVEGIVLCPVGRSAKHLAKFESGELPIVLADRYFPGLQLPYVVSDNHAGAKEATDYLIQNGHQRIACLQGLPETSPNDDRLRGYRDAMAAHQIPVDEALIVGDGFGEQNGYIAAKSLLSAAGDFTAILAFSNLISLGAIHALTEAGLRIPDDTSIISFDDQPYSAFLAAPMTTVAQRSSEMGTIAVRMLFDRIQSSERMTPQGVMLPTSLVARGSVQNLRLLENQRGQRHVCG
jgi:LacI family transcriptional regulator